MPKKNNQQKKEAVKIEDNVKIDENDYQEVKIEDDELEQLLKLKNDYQEAKTNYNNLMKQITESRRNKHILKDIYENAFFEYLEKQKNKKYI